MKHMIISHQAWSQSINIQAKMNRILPNMIECFFAKSIMIDVYLWAFFWDFDS